MEYFIIIFYSPFGMIVPKVIDKLENLKPEIEELYKSYTIKPTMVEILTTSHFNCVC